MPLAVTAVHHRRRALPAARVQSLRQGRESTIGHFSQVPEDAVGSARYRAFMPLPPSLSPDQRQAALDKAAAARRLRAELKEKLKMGSLTLKELLDQSANDDVVAKMKVVSVLESLPGLGKVKARRLMEEIGISETRKVQGLGQQQRRRLLEKLAP